MRLYRLRLRGITEAFPNEVSVDFDALGPGLIALVGENGAGKSTLIGSIFAALFRQLPGQKRSLYDFATHPQPEIDLTFSVNGARYRSLFKIDPKSRQMESYLFSGDGKPLTNGKKEPFEDLVRKCAGTPDFFLSSIFSTQKRTGNFLSLDRSDRKELFIRELLGLDRLRLVAAAARDKSEEVAKSTISLEGQCKSLRELVDAGAEDPAEVEAQLEDESLLAGKKDLSDLTERGAALAACILTSANGVLSDAANDRASSVDQQLAHAKIMIALLAYPLPAGSFWTLKWWATRSNAASCADSQFASYSSS